MERFSPHARGLLIAGAGALCFTPDTLLIRLVGTGTWELVFWRSVFVLLAISLFLGTRYGRTLPSVVRAGGAALVLSAALSVLTTVLFIFAVANTRVANVLIILSTAPFFAAVFSRLFLGETVPRRTWAAILAAAAGMAIVFYDSLGGGRLTGDLLAFGATCAVGGNLVVLRGARRVDMIPAYGIGAVAAAVCSAPLVTTFALSAADLGWFILMGIVVATAFALIIVGTRYLAAPEVALLLLLETVLGPFWVWLVIGEKPTFYAFLGGALVVTTLILHSLVGLRRARAVAT